MTAVATARDISLDKSFLHDPLLNLRMNEDEFVAWADEDVRAEFVDGEVDVLMSESDEHANVGLFLVTLMNIFISQRGLGRLFHDNFMVRLRTGLRRVPDIHFVSQERVGLIRPTEVDGAPDLVVEIVSEDSVDRDRRRKFREYEEGGVREYWIIDPGYRRVEVYVLSSEDVFERLSAQDGVQCSQVLEGFWVRPDWLWQRPLPNVVEIAKEIGII